MNPTDQIAVILQDFVSVSEAAKALGIGERMVQTAAKRGHLGAAKFGRDWKISRAAIKSRLKKHGSGRIHQKNRKYLRAANA